MTAELSSELLSGHDCGYRYLPRLLLAAALLCGVVAGVVKARNL